ncbi:MAG TPA: Smr/MutS family protein [Xanthomonadales bacterium]|nr:Smr/MutS family protein [Xanthomonadales bacterium]
MSKIKKSDAEHFRAAMQNVRPLKTEERHHRSTPRPSPSLRLSTPLVSTEAESRMGDPEITSLVADACEQSRPLLRDGLPRKALRILGSPRNPAVDSFDLHGMTEIQARKALGQFLRASLADGLGCIRVVHGKGLRSKGAPVLKLMSWQLLWQHPLVMALKPCAPNDGGTGAVLVMLNPGPEHPA